MSREMSSSTTLQRQQSTQTGAGDKVISFWQAITLIPSTVLAVSILTLPRNIALATDGSGISLVVVSGLVPLFIVWMITKLGQRFPGLTVVGYTQKLLTFGGNKRAGRWLAFPFMVPIVVWWAMSVAMISRIFGEVQRSVVFPQTPLWFMVGTMLFVSALVATSKAEVIARLNEFLFPFIMIPLLLICVLALGDAEWTNLLPLLNMTWGQFWDGVIQGIFAYGGVSIILIAMASYQQPEKAMKAHFIGVGMVVAVYGFVMISTMSVFSHNEVERLMWPTLEIVKNIRFPGFILERIESGFLAIWVAAVFTTLSNLLSATVHLISEYFAIKDNQRIWVLCPIFVIIYAIALWPEDVYATFQFTEKIQWFGLLAPFIIFPVLLLIAGVRRVGNGQSKER